MSESSVASARVTHERGPMPRQIRAAALAGGGEALWERMLGMVSEPCRARFSHPISPFEWIPLELSLELHAAWAELKQHDPMKDRGEEAARDMLGGLQGWILRMASPAFLVANLPRMFQFYYRGGWARVVKAEPHHAVIALHALGFPENWYAQGIPGWLHVALELTGAKDIRVFHEPPGPEDPPERHTYVLDWQG